MWLYLFFVLRFRIMKSDNKTLAEEEECLYLLYWFWNN